MGRETTEADVDTEHAMDLCKQVITLDTLVIALTITFARDFASNGGDGPKLVLATSWLFFWLSVLSGLWAMFIFAGVHRGNPRWPIHGVFIFFEVGLLTAGLASLWAMLIHP